MKSKHIVIVGLIISLAVVAFGSHPYISDPGTLIDGFENVNDWVVEGTGATAENDTSIFKQGNQSIKLNATGGNLAQFYKTVSLDFSSGNGFSFWVYVYDRPKISYFQVAISSDPMKKYFAIFPTKFVNGWNLFAIAKSRFINEGGDSWDNTMVRIRFRVAPIAGEDASVNFDDFRFGIVGQPKVIMTFDDELPGQIDKAYPIMAANSQRGVEFVSISNVGLSGRMTLADLQTLKVAGWDISNHTVAHKNLTSVSQEEMEADIDGGYNWLVANGFGNTAKFFAYPGGQWNDTVVAKVKQRHILARIVNAWGDYYFDILNFDDLQYKLSCYEVRNDTTVATVQTEIDRAIERSGLLILLFHYIVDSNADSITKCLTADFQAISDYLKAKQDAGLLEVITFSDYYNALIKWHRLEPEPFCPEMDFNGDCKVDFKDLAIFSQSWLKCNLEPKSACWE